MAKPSIDPLSIQPSLFFIKQANDVAFDLGELLRVLLDLCQGTKLFKLIARALVHECPPNRNCFGAEEFARQDLKLSMAFFPLRGLGSRKRRGVGCGSMQLPQLDKHARNARTWLDGAKVTYAASTHLFDSRNPILYYPAATLAHHALEMFLKSALICEGMTVFNPVILKSLDPGYTLTRANCAWGHSLLELTRRLAEKRTDFRLRAEMDIRECRELLMPMSLQTGFELFDRFHSDLCSPQEDKQSTAVSSDHKRVLDVLVLTLQPFLSKVRWQ